MKILYVSTLCSDKMFKKIYENSEVKPQQQAQKFHSLLSKGLSSSVKDIHVMSRPPINETTDEKLKSNFTEANENITYQYLKTSRNAFLRHITIFVAGFFNTLSWSFKNRKEERVVVCDILNLSISLSAFMGSKISGTRNIAVVTDIPSYMQNYSNKRKSILKKMISSIYTGLSQYFAKRYDYYVILTQQMNDLINPKKKPFVVIEGMVDINMSSVSNSLKDKYADKVIIYAGALKEKAGIRNLIEAFIRLNIDDVKLWLYGSGEMEDDIRTYESIDNRIKYFGVVPNHTVVKEQLKATLLVNPRPSNEEFTKYSFPSKNMEYMVSGTPIITTPLKGMPDEYNDHVYLFDNETIEGMSNTLNRILNKDKVELHNKGLNTKEFVLKKKNNVVQAEKIIHMTSKE